MTDQAEAIKALAEIRDATKPGDRRDALEWSLALCREDAAADTGWSLGDYQPVPGDPLATLRVRLLREIYGEITAEEMTAWSREAIHGAWASALAQVIGTLTGENPLAIRHEAGRAVHKAIGPPPPWAPGAS